jgi:hypothetical protein
MALPLDVDKAPEVTNILTANETAKPAVKDDTKQHKANIRTAIQAQYGLCKRERTTGAKSGLRKRSDTSMLVVPNNKVQKA